jgi:hypothetical protein
MEEFSLEFFGNHINKLLENTNIGVRSETINLVKEIYLYKRKDIFKFVKFSKDSIKVFIIFFIILNYIFYHIKLYLFYFILFNL